MIKIIAGEFRGRKLFTPPDLNTRPTANRTREALFNILAFRLKDAHVLDLFAGSGALGLEALSRGAADVVFVEDDRKTCEIIAKNISLCGVMARAKAHCVKVQNYRHFGGKFSLVLMDPPYKQQLVEQALNMLAKSDCLANGCEIVAEHETGYLPAYDDAFFELTETRTYGKAALSFFVYKQL